MNICEGKFELNCIKLDGRVYLLSNGLFVFSIYFRLCRTAGRKLPASMNSLPKTLMAMMYLLRNTGKKG